MATSSKDIEILWNRYFDEGVKRGISVVQFFESNGVPPSKDQKLVKIIRHEHNECQLYIQRFDDHMGFERLTFEGTRPVYVLDWKYVVALLSYPVVRKISMRDERPEVLSGEIC